MSIKNKLLLISIFIFFSSCNEFQRVLKSEDIKVKYDAAEKYYENQEYKIASRLYEQIIPKYREKQQN